MISEMPLFSIVIANYNHGLFLEAAILSILNQNCNDFELLIIDGGSTDNSLEIIKRYSKKISYWVSEKDKGQSDAFNKGFSKAKGQFYFWLNADDILLPNSLMTAKNNIRKNPNVLWFVANTIWFSKEGKIQKCTNGPKWHNLLLKNAEIYVYGPTSIFHKSMFVAVNGFDENLNYVMDTDLWQRFKIKGFKFNRIKKYFWAFRIHKGSKTSHAYSSNPNVAFQKEINYINQKNGIYYSKKGVILQKIYKTLSGCYLKSYIDTFQMKNNSIFDIL